jgi:hypothetical protein
MARSRNKPEKGPSAGPQPVAPQVIYEATLGANGAVIRVQPPINQARAIALRLSDANVVVCGPNKTANSVMARDIEQAANGQWKRCKPHIRADSCRVEGSPPLETLKSARNGQVSPVNPTGIRSNWHPPRL